MVVGVCDSMFSTDGEQLDGLSLPKDTMYLKFKEPPSSDGRSGAFQEQVVEA